MKVRVSMPGACMAVEFEDQKAIETFRKLNEVILSIQSNTGLQESQVRGIKKDPVLTSEDPESEKQLSVLPVNEPIQDQVELKYKGFLYLRCPGCGAIHGFSAKDYQTYYKCRDCGHKMMFDTPLVPLLVNCECGRQFRYQTNQTEPMFDMPCLECGTLVAVAWNEKKGLYEPIRQGK